MRKILAPFVGILLVCSYCQAQVTAMALTGHIRDLKVETDSVSFRLTGHFSYPIHGKKDGTWNIDVEDVFIKISMADAQADTTNETGFKPSSIIPLNKIADYLKDRNQTQKTVVIGIASPVLYFSDYSVIEKVEAKKIVVLGG